MSVCQSEISFLESDLQSGKLILIFCGDSVGQFFDLASARYYQGGRFVPMSFMVYSMPVIKNMLFYEYEKSYLFIRLKSINTADLLCSGCQQQQLH